MLVIQNIETTSKNSSFITRPLFTFMEDKLHPISFCWQNLILCVLIIITSFYNLTLVRLTHTKKIRTDLKQET